MKVLWEQLERAAQFRGDDPAINENGQYLGWRDARNMAARLAHVLKQHGVNEGDRVALISPNSLFYMLLPFAVECAGGIFVPLNSRLAVPEIIEQLEDCQPKLLIAADPFVEVAEEAVAAAGVTLLVIGSKRATISPETSLDLLAAESEPLSPIGRPVGSPVAIYYTGGTTGRPKGVILTADRLVINALQWAHALDARHDERLIVVAPMFHMVAGLNCIIAAVLACNICILDRFQPEQTLRAVADEGITNMALVPAMIDMLLASEEFGQHDISSLRVLSYGGSPISVNTLSNTLEKFPGVRLYQVYGQTEGGPTISVLPAEFHSTDPECAMKLRSAGRPLALTDIRIVGADGKPCECGETGEIVVRGPAVAPGYWNRPHETEMAFRNGWLHTGDAGYLDEEGFLYIVDRIKDMIVTGGENVYSAEVERVISQHTSVEQCAVIGVPSTRWGESVHAIVRLHPSARTCEADILAFCRDQLAGFKVPKSVEITKHQFPLTGANKIDKRALRSSHSTNNSQPLNTDNNVSD